MTTPYAITPKQYGLIAQAEAAVQRAQEQRALVIQAIVAGHDIPDGATYEGAQQYPPALLIGLPRANTQPGTT